jgi:tetratricopeptide (TPR) repeat protein
MTTAMLLIALVQAASNPARRPPDATALRQEAERQLAAGRQGEAERLLATAAEQFGSVEALLRLSRLQSGRGDAAAALESLRKALTAAPNSEEALSAFAQMSIAAGAPASAIRALDALVRICPTVAQHRYLLGVALMRAGDMPAAVDSLRIAERLEPARAPTLLALGMALNNRQLYAEAKPFLTRSLDLEPENVDVLAALAEAEQGVGDDDAGAIHAQRALAKASDHPTANFVTGLIAMDAGRYLDARRAFERVVVADPLSAKAHYQLSLACTRLGDSAAAAQHLDQYRRALRELETRLEDLRKATGITPAAAAKK